MNHNTNFFYEKNKSLLILRNVFEWFLSNFEVIYPDQLISDTALLDNFENLKKYADFLKKFNTGIVDIRQVEVSEDKVKSNLFVRDRTNIDLQMNLARTNNIIGKQKCEWSAVIWLSSGMCCLLLQPTKPGL